MSCEPKLRIVLTRKPCALHIQQSLEAPDSMTPAQALRNYLVALPKSLAPNEQHQLVGQEITTAVHG